jgi:DNA-directed RNA polymerase specialized sigma24 family protein
MGDLRFIPVAVPLSEGENVPADGAELASLEDRLMVRRFVRSLPLDVRKLVFAIFWREMSQADAAAALGMHPRTVSRVLQRVLLLGREAMDATLHQLTA